MLAFALIAGVTYFGGRMVAQCDRQADAHSRSSARSTARSGFGFGALKGLILASLGFLLVVLVIDTAAAARRSGPTG